MENRIKKLSYISFVLLSILLTFAIITVNKLINIEGLNMRSIKVILSYFFHLPLFIINLTITIKVFLFYYKNKSKITPKYLYFIIPSIIYYFVCFIYIIVGLIK